MSAWAPSGNPSLDTRKKGDLPLNGNSLFAAERWFKKSLDFTLAFSTHLLLLKLLGRGVVGGVGGHYFKSLQNALSHLFEGSEEVYFCE